jgi:PEP-CTERM motif-containing protein
MRHNVVVGSVLSTLVLALWCPPAVADPIQITTGSLQVVGSTGTLSVAGTRGFTLSGTLSTLDGVFRPWEQCHLAPVCVPGTTLDLEAYVVGLGLRAIATLDGQTFSNVGGLISPNQAGVRFTGSVIAPAFDSATATVVAPFRFDGQFSHLEGEELLVGSGLATLFLRRSFGAAEGLPPAWDYTGVRYDFSPAFTPTPEPATLLLTAAGLLGLARRRLRRTGKSPR